MRNSLDKRPDNPPGIVAIAGALPMELAGLRKSSSFTRAEVGGTEYFKGGVRGRDAALFVSGIGEERAYETARAACQGLPLRAYVSIGLSGSLNTELGPGDVVIGDRVKTLASNGFSEYRCDLGLLETVSQTFALGNGPVIGPLLASDRVIVAAAEKKSLSASLECLAIDMESAGAARAAKQAGVPFIAIRAISDALHEDMPVDFNRFTVDGAMDWPFFLLHVLKHPGTIMPLMRLGRNSRLAVSNLTAAVEKALSDL